MALTKEQWKLGEYLNELFFRMGIVSIGSQGDLVIVRTISQTHIVGIKEGNDGEYVEWQEDGIKQKLYLKNLVEKQRLVDMKIQSNNKRNSKQRKVKINEIKR